MTEKELELISESNLPKKIDWAEVLRGLLDIILIAMMGVLIYQRTILGCIMVN